MGDLRRNGLIHPVTGNFAIWSGNRAQNIAALNTVGRALEGGSFDRKGRLQHAEISQREFRRALFTVHHALNRPELAIFIALRLTILYPLMATFQIRDSLHEVAAAYQKAEPTPAPAPAPQTVTAEEYGRTLQQNAELLVDGPDAMNQAARTVLAAKVEELIKLQLHEEPPTVKCVVHDIRAHLAPSDNSGLWIFGLGLQISLLAAIILGPLYSTANGLQFGDLHLSLMAAMLAVIGCGINGHLQIDILAGFDHCTLATAKTIAKIPNFLVLVTGLLTTLILRGEVSVVPLMVAAFSTVLLAASGLCADLFINHAEAAIKAATTN